jgi:hypothetical protein
MIIIRVLFCSSFEVVFLLKKRESSLLCFALLQIDAAVLETERCLGIMRV